MNPDAVHDTEREHDHERERATVANERQGDAGDRQNGNRHPDVLEDVGENERRDSDHKEQTELVPGNECNEKTGQK